MECGGSGMAVGLMVEMLPEKTGDEFDPTFINPWSGTAT